MHPTPLPLSNRPQLPLSQLPVQSGETSSHTNNELLHPAEELSPPHPYSTYHFSFEMEQSGSTDLQIQTQDGDTITLQMQSQWQMAVEYGETNTASSQSIQAALQQYQGYAIHYQVDGELDEEEQQALNGVMQQLSVTTQHFFSGDLAGAIDSLEEFKLDSETFASISLTMERSVSYNMVEQYQEVNNMAPVQLPTHETSGGLVGLAGFTQNLFQMMDAVNEELERILVPEEFVYELMQQSIYRDPRSSELTGSLMNRVDQFLHEMALQWARFNPDTSPAVPATPQHQSVY